MPNMRIEKIRWWQMRSNCAIHHNREDSHHTREDSHHTREDSIRISEMYLKAKEKSHTSRISYSEVCFVIYMRDGRHAKQFCF